MAVRLFPARWQARYGEEFVAVLAETGTSVGVGFDVLLAALDAHLHPTSPPRRWPLMIQQLRRHELVIFAAWVVFGVAIFGFGWMTKDEPFVHLRDSQPHDRARLRHHQLRRDRQRPRAGRRPACPSPSA